MLRISELFVRAHEFTLNVICCVDGLKGLDSEHSLILLQRLGYLSRTRRLQDVARRVCSEGVTAVMMQLVQELSVLYGADLAV